MKIFYIIVPSETKYLQNGSVFQINKGFYHPNHTKITHKKLSSINTIPVVQNWHIERYGFKLTQSEIDIFNMHRHAWTLFLKSKEKFCMLMENNIKLENFSLDDAFDFTEQIKWDIIFPFKENDFLNKKDILNNTKIINRNQHEQKDVEPYLLGKRWGSSIYILSRQGAKKLLKIKTITQVLDDEILMLSHEGKLMVFCKPFPWFNYNQQSTLINLQREAEIYKSILKNSKNVWAKDEKNKIRYLLSLLSDVAHQQQIVLLLQGGSLLGYWQYRKILPWDDDVDIGIHIKSIDKFLSHLPKDIINFAPFIEQGTGAIFYKLWLNEGTTIKSCTYKFPFVDLWLYDFKGNDIVFNNNIVCPNSAKENPKKIVFEGSMFYIPYNTIECLDQRYKTWKTMIRVYSWSHKLENNSFYPLKVHIKTDKNGRLIAPLYKLIK